MALHGMLLFVYQSSSWKFWMIFIVLLFICILCFEMQSNQEKRLKEEEWLPDLQLRLSQRSANEEDTHHKSKYEMNTMLSLSPYSSRQQEQPTEKQKEETQTKAWSSQTTTGKADLSLSI